MKVLSACLLWVKTRTPRQRSHVSFRHFRTHAPQHHTRMGRDNLLNHLVGEQLHRVGHVQAQRRGSLEIDHQLELGRL
jgi:hypothetical protein